MYKALALTALAGSVAANSWSWNWNTAIMNSDNNYNYYQLSLTAEFDTGYQTLYNRQYSSNAYQAAMPQSSQSYELNIFSWFKFTFWHQAFESYYATYDYKLDLIDFTPYGQAVEWSRFDSWRNGGNKFNAYTQGYRYANFLNMWTNVKENAKTCKWSVFDIQDSNYQPTCSYNDNKVYEYQDSVWQYNLPTEQSIMQDILGYHQWFEGHTTNS
jgi:hypothetical protein